MRSARVDPGRVLMRVVLIVLVPVIVLQISVLMLVLVPLGQVQP